MTVFDRKMEIPIGNDPQELENLEADAYRLAAMDDYSGSDVQIDENAVVSIGEDGAYVAAWVFVANTKI